MKRLLILALVLTSYINTWADEEYSLNRPKTLEIEFSNKSEIVELLLDKIIKYAEDGDADAQVVLSSLYRWGNKVEQDYKKSFSWAKRAAKQKHIPGQYILGIYYYQGVGTKKNRIHEATNLYLTLNKNIGKTMVNAIRKSVAPTLPMTPTSQ